MNTFDTVRHDDIVKCGAEPPILTNREDETWCTLDEVIMQETPKKVRCTICRKCFRDVSFAEKHVRSMHTNIHVIDSSKAGFSKKIEGDKILPNQDIDRPQSSYIEEPTHANGTNTNSGPTVSKVKDSNENVCAVPAPPAKLLNSSSETTPTSLDCVESTDPARKLESIGKGEPPANEMVVPRVMEDKHCIISSCINEPEGSGVLCSPSAAGAKAQGSSQSDISKPSTSNVDVEHAGKELIKEITPNRFKCMACGKRFKGMEYAEKHVRKSHPDFEITSSTSAVAVNNASVAREDALEATEESDLPRDVVATVDRVEEEGTNFGKTHDIIKTDLENAKTKPEVSDLKPLQIVEKTLIENDPVDLKESCVNSTLRTKGTLQVELANRSRDDALIDTEEVVAAIVDRLEVEETKFDETQACLKTDLEKAKTRSEVSELKPSQIFDNLLIENDSVDLKESCVNSTLCTKESLLLQLANRNLDDALVDTEEAVVMPQAMAVATSTARQDRGKKRKKRKAPVCGGFNVVAVFDNTLVEAEGRLSFSAGDMFEVMQWSKFGWWWARSLTDPSKIGWLAPAFCQPAPPPPSSPLNSDKSAKEPIKAGKVEELFGGSKTPSKQLELEPASQPTSTSLSQTGSSNKEVALPTWPPLPPLGIQKPSQPPLPTGPPPGKEDSILAIDEFEQKLVFAKDGKVGRPQNECDFGQLQHFFNYNAWAEKKNMSSMNSKKRTKPTRDGGLKQLKC